MSATTTTESRSDERVSRSLAVIDAATDRNYAAEGIDADERLHGLELDVSDLIADLHHLADAYGLDWPATLDRADLAHIGDVGDDGHAAPVKLPDEPRPGTPRLRTLIELADAVTRVMAGEGAIPLEVAGACQWFALCTNEATTTEPHPTLGAVPICGRCKAKVAALR
jgi:hypothetical protein